MILQFYSDDKLLRAFDSANSMKLFDVTNCDEKIRRRMGLPPFKNWKKLSWGYEIVVKFSYSNPNRYDG